MSSPIPARDNWRRSRPFSECTLTAENLPRTFATRRIRGQKRRALTRRTTTFSRRPTEALSPVRLNQRQRPFHQFLVVVCKPELVVLIDGNSHDVPTRQGLHSRGRIFPLVVGASEEQNLSTRRHQNVESGSSD